jgi:hypothetical protein
MSNYKTRQLALEMARSIARPGQQPSQLIEAAYEIEQYLIGSAKSNAAIDFHGAPIEPIDPSINTWSGTACDLAQLCNQGNTLINKARQVGMTRFLIELAIENTKVGKRVLFFGNNGHNTNDARKKFVSGGGETSLADFKALNAIATGAEASDAETLADYYRGSQKFDLVIVDGLAFLPYSRETDFLTGIMPIGMRFVMASEPATERGLFWDLWQNSTSFQKVMLTWNTPLFPDPKRHERIEELKRNIADDRFRNEFQCEFRPVKD